MASESESDDVAVAAAFISELWRAGMSLEGIAHFCNVSVAEIQAIMAQATEIGV